ncbi:alpha/beta hydrolase fold protein [Colletotrichum tofieldiae]|uniref:Alpha/beta hydrolase fold protein n=1 Tax=Colletotrichum tofieldiae TaxID=708197 RepID=A0A166Y0H0_9PEZI|nr:alpha/beta hydrolase fold protein [Colletotrichum tofieldiae]GKT55386.1 alpha/beta hydrolase fold protein [Colletotrichum tofieldiae]GKT75326.1 alpha/beta hydrolase fold protein [Colletotrichum tofieldiae]GKT82982.1 alpha/beta hydrolase fold protein [Colletotrichum tofieldiae]
MASAQTTLGPLGVLSLILRLPFALAIFLSIVFRGLPLAIRRGIPIRFWLQSAQYRVVLGYLKPREIQYLAAPARQVYPQWIAKQRATASRLGNVGALDRLGQDVEPLKGTDANIMWLGDRRKAAKVVLFFHGGGYVAPVSSGHFTWCWNCYVDDGPGAKDEVAVAMLEYTLCPGARYPTQLRQAVAALNHILRSGIAPGHLAIGGDSAGGNLACQVVHHILHPHPEVETVRLSGPLAGVFMVSPLLTFRTDTASFRDNHRVDMLSAAIVAEGNRYIFPADFAKKQAANPHQPMPLDGDLEWLGEIQTVSKSIYITAGAQEVFRDDVRAFAEAVRRHNPGVDFTLDVAANEVHDSILLEAEFDVVGDATKRMRQWAAKCLV